MPFVPGGTLRQRLERGPLSLDETLALGRALARALGRAHARGIVHRDVKPENVLFDGSGRPLLADLGIAKHFERESAASAALSAAGEFRGTALYAAPEQAADASRVGPPADVHALGVVAYECLAGAAPHAADTVAEVLARKSSGLFEPLERVRRDVPPWLARLVAATLAPDPADRPPDGAALARALEGERRAARWWPSLVVLTALAAVGAVLARTQRTASTPARPAFEKDVAVLAGYEDGDRDGALGRVVRAREGAVTSALDAALARRDGPWLRRARLARGVDAPRSDDVLAAAPLLSREDLDLVLARALEKGLAGESAIDAALALRERLPGRGDAAHLLGLVLLEARRRDEAVEALRAARQRPQARALVAALREVDAFARAWDECSLLFSEPVGIAGERVHDALAHPELATASASVIGGTIAPILSRLRDVAVAPRLDDQVHQHPRFVAVERALADFLDRLADEDLATFEAAAGPRRAWSRNREAWRRHRLVDRLAAARDRLRARDPDLAIEVELRRLEAWWAVGEHSEGWIRAWFDGYAALEAECPDDLRRGRVLHERAWLGWASRFDALPSERPALTEDVLATARRGFALARREKLRNSPFEFARYVAWSLIALGRLDECEAFLRESGQDLSDAKLELMRRRGLDAEVVARGRALLRAEGEVRTCDVRLVRGTLALALAAVGEKEAARVEVAALAEGWGEAALTLYEIDLQTVRTLVERGAR